MLAAVLLMGSAPVLVPVRSWAASPSPAEVVLASARAQAARENKAVLTHFSASWCSWCRRLESFLHDDTVAPIIERHFVPVRLVVRERDANKHLDHPGGMVVLARLGGTDRGLPFTAVVAADGSLVANSLVPVSDPAAPGGVENMGYPGDAASIAAYLDLLQAGAPALSPDERKVLETWLVAHAPPS